MIVIDNVKTLQELLDKTITEKRGFVPTMGALHQGHISLVQASVKNDPRTVVSIFVNPTQFNDPKDLEKYPRNLDSDLKLLESVLREDDIVFTPSYKDLYSNEQPYDINLKGLDSVMEGKYRPGHFEGVIRVVKLLFEIVKPQRAYFGKKDFQQLSIMRKLVSELDLNIKIIACPTQREDNGLAMSSRNEHLSPTSRSDAASIYANLKKHCAIATVGDLTKVKSKLIKTINSIDGFSVEYFEIVDDISLKSIRSASDIDSYQRYYGCIAVNVGDIRLIDNTEFSFLFLKG